MFRTAFLLLAMTTFSAAAAELSGKPRVMDGDTLEIAGQTIHLAGIDAPETNQTCRDAGGNTWPCGLEATYALANIIGTQKITCKGEASNAQDETIAVCFAGRHRVNAMMITRGWAVADRPNASDYLQEEEDARVHKRGLWRGSFEPPWQWRQKQS